MEVRIYGTPKELAALVHEMRVARIVSTAEWAEETAQKIPDLLNPADAGEPDNGALSSE